MTDDARVCPKCGNEMRKKRRMVEPSGPLKEFQWRHWEYYWLCDCGHEENVKG